MNKTLKKRFDKILKLTSDWVLENWSLYTYIRTGYLIIFFPSIVLLSVLFFPNTLGNDLLLSVALAMAPLLVLFLLDTRRTRVVWANPEAFVKSEKVAQIVEKSFFVSIPSLLIGVMLIVALERLGLKEWMNAFVFVFVSMYIFFIGIGIAMLFNSFESLLGLAVRNHLPDSVRERLKFLDFYVSPILCVVARLRITLDAFSNPNVLMIRKKLHFFKDALRMYNTHLRTTFDFVIREPDRFYKYVRLTAFSKDTKNINKVKKDLTTLIKHLGKKEDPFVFIKTMKAMVGESVSRPKDIYDEIGIEPRPFKKWILVHSDLLSFIITLISLLISIIIAMLLR